MNSYVRHETEEVLKVHCELLEMADRRTTYTPETTNTSTASNISVDKKQIHELISDLVAWPDHMDPETQKILCAVAERLCSLIGERPYDIFIGDNADWEHEWYPSIEAAVAALKRQ